MLKRKHGTIDTNQKCCNYSNFMLCCTVLPLTAGVKELIKPGSFIHSNILILGNVVNCIIAKKLYNYYLVGPYELNLN